MVPDKDLEQTARTGVATKPYPRYKSFLIQYAPVWIGGLLVFVIYLTTLQVIINGSSNPYATDIGEIQNALPRWGTIHFPGYPLFSLIGSTFVTLFRWSGIEPAVSSSLFSAMWGAVAVALLIMLMQAYDAKPAAAVGAGMLFGLSTSFWVDSSIAEIHTLSMVLMFASVIFAVRFGRSGKRSDLLWLALFSSQAVLHQRANIFMGIGLLALVLQQPKRLIRGLPLAIAIGLASTLIYLYLPLRAWQGADWTFNQPGTWGGFWSLFFDTKAERIVSVPGSLQQFLERGLGVINLLKDEWPLGLICLGLVSGIVLTVNRSRKEAFGIFLIWLPYLSISLIIWEGRISDALLAVNIPVIAFASFGLALLATYLISKNRYLGAGIIIAYFALAGSFFVRTRPFILEITRDDGAESTIAMATEADMLIQNNSPKRTLMALWGNDFWALAYAQAFNEKIPRLKLVDHNADLETIMKNEGGILTLDRTFYLRPLTWWDEQFGQVYLSAFTEDVTEVRLAPKIDSTGIATENQFDLGNGIVIRDTNLQLTDEETLKLSILWQTKEQPKYDYSVAVHLVSNMDPTGPGDIIAQADTQNPVSGWYPTSRWSIGEFVLDKFTLDIPPGAEPVAVRISMYRQTDQGEFINSPWLTLPVP